MNRDFPQSVRAAVRARAGDRCEACRLASIDHFHHKLRRGQGGVGSLENCAGLCHVCHEWVHANPEDSYELGWLIKPGPVNMGLKAK